MKQHAHPTLVYINLAVFRASFAVFVMLAAMELIVPGLVTSWFNPIFLLIIAIGSFLIHLLLNEE